MSRFRRRARIAASGGPRTRCILLGSVVFAVLWGSVIATTQEGADYASSWPPLIQARSFRQARALCQAWLTLKSPRALAEAHKCLTMVELETARVGGSDPQSVRDPAVEPRYEGPGVDRALEHVNRAIVLAPGDFAAHLGRLVLLERSGRYDDLAAAFSGSLPLFREPDTFDIWLQFPYRRFDEGHYPQSLVMYQALLKHYPRSFKAAEGAGVVLTEMQRTDEALPYLERAVDLAPDDPLSLWNLALAYDSAERDAGAEVLYRKAIERQSFDRIKNAWYCMFATFLEVKRKDRDTACELQKKHCAEDKRTACLLVMPGPPEPMLQSRPDGGGEPPPGAR